MNWTQWREHFERKVARHLPPTRAQRTLSGPVAAALASSLARFQVGEAGEGRIVRQIAHCRWPQIDDDYRRALALFVAEERRHARILATAVRHLAGQTLATSWSERLFVFGRRLCGLRLKLMVLLAAEVIGIAFYGRIASRLPMGGLKAALTELGSDEADHLRFHQDLFRTQVTNVWRRVIFRGAWLAVGNAAALVVLWDHRHTLRLLDVPVLAMARDLRRLLRVTGRLTYEHPTTVEGPVVAVAS